MMSQRRPGASRSTPRRVSAGRPSTIVLASIGLMFLTGCGEDPPPAEPTVRPVRSIVIGAATDARSRTFAGTAQFGSQSRISFRVAGTLVEVPVKVGSEVKQGDLLARIDATDYELQVQEAVAARAQAYAELRTAEAAFKRISALYASKTSSRQDFDQARAQRDSARAAAFSIGRRLELARSQVRYTRLEAPVDGVVSAVGGAVSENVGPGQPVVVLSSGDQLEVTFTVPESMIAQLKTGDRVAVAFDALSDKRFEAVLTEVGVTGAGTGSTFPVTARVEAPDAAIRAGMAAEVTLESADDEPPVLRVPPFSVGSDDAGHFVFVVEPTGPERGTLSRRSVTIGDVDGDGLAVGEGLAKGDRLVIAGVRALTDGLAVRLPRGEASEPALDEPAPAPADPAPADPAPTPVDPAPEGGK